MALDDESFTILMVFLLVMVPVWMFVVTLVLLVLWALFLAICDIIASCCKGLGSSPHSNQQHQDLAQFRSQMNRRQEQARPLERSVLVKKYLYSRTLQEGESTRVIAAVIATTTTQENQVGIITSMRNRVESTTSSIVESVRSVVAPKQECCICMDTYKQGDTVAWAKYEACNHMYYEDCIVQWLDKHDDCPLCRTKLLEGDYSEK